MILRPNSDMDSGMATQSGIPRSRLSEDDLMSLVPPQSGNREVKVGLFVIAAVVATLVALFTLTDAGTFRNRYYVTTSVQDVGGLRKGDPVQMRGVNIGRVRGFQIGPAGVAVTLELEREYEIPDDSRVAFRSSGLLGGLIAEVVPGDAEALLEDGDLLPGIGAQTDLLATAKGLSTSADTVLDRVQALLSPGTIGAVGQSATDLQVLLGEVSALAAEQRRELATLNASLQRSAAGVEDATTAPELRRSVVRLDSITARLDNAIASLGRGSSSLAVVLGRVERGEGTLGKLSTDDALYTNLNSAAASMNTAAGNMNALVDSIKKNPRKYLKLEVF